MLGWYFLAIFIRGFYSIYITVLDIMRHRLAVEFSIDPLIHFQDSHSLSASEGY
jgi:hypothetical protein